MREYKPRKDSFPDRTLKYLKENGESANADIRKAIGLNEWSKDHSCFNDRSNYHFDVIIDTLQKAGLIVRTKRGFYRLAISKEEAAEFLTRESEEEIKRMERRREWNQMQFEKWRNKLTNGKGEDQEISY